MKEVSSEHSYVLLILCRSCTYHSDPELVHDGFQILQVQPVEVSHDDPIGRAEGAQLYLRWGGGGGRAAFGWGVCSLGGGDATPGAGAPLLGRRGLQHRVVQGRRFALHRDQWQVLEVVQVVPVVLDQVPARQAVSWRCVPFCSMSG